MGGRGFNTKRLLRLLQGWAEENDYIPGKGFTMTVVVALLLKETNHRWWQRRKHHQNSDAVRAATLTALLLHRLNC